VSAELPAQKTADWLTAKKTPPDGNGGVMERDEMIRILEEIIRDPDANPTARCTAIRTLREFPRQPEDSVFADLDLYPDVELRGKGRGSNN
jgi:hypothetical protein